MGCTSLMTSDYYVRNYDFSPYIYDGTFVIQKNDKGQWLCGNTELMLGRLDGMNKHGLSCGLHFVNNNPHKKGFIGSLIVRIVLEMCQNLDEAIQLLKQLPHTASYNYSLLDRKGNFAIFEASPNKINIIYGNKHLSCVNMFQTEEMKVYNRNNVAFSLERIEALSELSEDKKRAHEVHKWFSDQTSPVFFTDYEHFLELYIRCPICQK